MNPDGRHAMKTEDIVIKLDVGIMGWGNDGETFGRFGTHQIMSR